MVFTEEDGVVIKFLHQNKGCSARRLVKEFLLKNWKIGGFDKLLKKTDYIDSDTFYVYQSSMKLTITG